MRTEPARDTPKSLGCRHEAFAEVILPDPVHHHTRGQVGFEGLAIHSASAFRAPRRDGIDRRLGDVAAAEGGQQSRPDFFGGLPGRGGRNVFGASRLISCTLGANGPALKPVNIDTSCTSILCNAAA